MTPNHSLNRSHCGVPAFGPPFHSGLLATCRNGPVSSIGRRHGQPNFSGSSAMAVMAKTGVDNASMKKLSTPLLISISITLAGCSAVAELAYDSAAGHEREQCQKLVSMPERQSCLQRVSTAERQANEARAKK
jgi:hypothetical protein